MAPNPITNKASLRKVFELQCQICKAMAHPLRLEIVERLHRRDMAAAELIGALDTSKANLSKHVNLLINAGIVEQRRNGRQVSYRLAYPEIHEACTIMRSILFRRLKTGGKLALALMPANR